jgi:PhnB protein
MVSPIPEGYHRVTPYLILNKAGDAIASYKAALGASEVMRLDDPSGKVHHAEIKIGDSRVMLADEHPDIQALSPKTIGGSPVSMHLYVEDVDASVERAVAAGRNPSARLRISFTATASAGSRTRSATAGSSQPTRKI